MASCCFRNENVAWFQVVVQNGFGMRFLESITNLNKNVDCLIIRQHAMFSNDCRQWNTVYKVCDVIRQAIVCYAMFVRRHEIGLINSGSLFGRVLKSLYCASIVGILAFNIFTTKFCSKPCLRA